MGKPKIRFQGFTEDWEQRKLGDLVEITSGEAPAKFQEGVTNYVKVDDLNYAYKTVIDAQNKVSSNGSTRIVKAGSIIFPKRGAAILTNKVRVLGVDSYMDTNMMALSSEKLDTDFLYTMLSKEGLYKIADTSTIPQINNKHIEPYEIYLPKLEEQRKIGKYFDSLDHLITLHQRKCEETRTLKAYMLQKMFPQNGQSVPKIRFSGFTDAWEQRKLGELLEFHNGFNGGAEKYGKGIPLISVMDILNNDFITSENIRTRADLTEDEYKRFKVEYGDVLFQRSSENIDDAGTSNVYLDSDKCAAFGGFVICGKKKSEYNPLFMKYGLTSRNVRTQIMSKAQGAQHINVSQETLQGVAIYIPSQEEQDKIGTYFSNLDHLITLHQRKCKELQDTKKYMLQNMFV